MSADRWAERCKAQRVHLLKGELPAHLSVFGFVLGRDRLSIYPVGAFEVCAGAVVYPPQTLNPSEEGSMLAAATGLAGMWDGTGILTLRFAKQRDGADFALLEVDEKISIEAKHLLTLRGLWDGEGASFLIPDGGKAPELPELTVAAVSAGENLYPGDSLISALLNAPETVRKAFTGWYEKILRHDG